MDKLSGTFKEKSQANGLILAHLCAADSGGKCCPPLSSARLHSSVTQLWAQTRWRRRWMVARLESAETRHKVSVNVGNIAHFISHIIFFFRNGSSNPPCAWTHSTELDYCRSEMSELRVWRIFSSGLIDSVLLEFICGICSVKTYFVCCVFQLLVVTVARISCTHVMLLFVSISSLSGFSELLSSVICRIWFQGSLFPFFLLVLDFLSFKVLTVGIPELISEVLMFTGSVTFFLFSDPNLGAFWMLFFQTFNFLWPSESQNKQKPSAPSNLYVLTGNCISLLIETQDGSQITEDPLGLFYFDSVIYKWSRCKRTGRINYL